MSTAILPITPDIETTQITYREILVTPEIAQRWLGLNTSNRKLKPRMVEAYAADMAAGRWLLNAEFVKFAGPEYAPRKLLDGQNRLHAVLRSQKSVTLCVAFNVPERTQSSMDAGSKRTVADNLTIAGLGQGSVVAAAARIAMQMRDGLVTWGSTPYTNSAIEEFVIQNPGLIDSAAVSARFAIRADVTKSLVAYTHWVLSDVDREAAFLFWRDAAEKAGLPSGDPVLTMSSWFANNRRQRQAVPLPVALSVIYRAWNYRRAGERWTFVRVNSAKGGVIDIPEPR